MREAARAHNSSKSLRARPRAAESLGNHTRIYLNRITNPKVNSHDTRRTPAGQRPPGQSNYCRISRTSWPGRRYPFVASDTAANAHLEVDCPVRLATLH